MGVIIDEFKKGPQKITQDIPMMILAS